MPDSQARRTSRPRRPYLVAAIYVAALSGAVWGLDWDLSWLSTASGRAAAWARCIAFVGAFGAPDLSPGMLADGVRLTASTLSIAAWGTALGVLGAYVIALGASEAVVCGPEVSARSVPRRLFVEGCRLLLDVMRGVPDFAWAILILTVPGPGPITGILALAITVAGALGRVYSELWDSIDPARYQAVSHAGGGRLATFVFGIQPLSARSMLSYTLMRAECTVRNASVIGVVGGGGLGGQLFDEFNYGHHDRVVTLLLFLLALTASVDVASNLVRRRLVSARGVANLRQALRRRCEVVIGMGLALGMAAAWLGDAWRMAWLELDRIEWQFLAGEFGQVLRPDLRLSTVSEAIVGAGLPLALAVLATTIAIAGAAYLALPGSVVLQLRTRTYAGEFLGRWARWWRWTLVLGARTIALVMRALPDVAWLLLAASCFRLGVLAGVFAVAVHSMGILARVFVEIVDDIPSRRFEPFVVGSRGLAYAYVAVPTALRDWRTYAVVQFESNVRAGLVLGIVGIGGLGDAFHTSFSHWNLPRAGTFLLAMVLLTTIIDRLSRRFRSAHVDVAAS